MPSLFWNKALFEPLGGPLVALVLGIVLAITAGAFFYVSLGHYQRRSGYAFELSLLRTLVLVIVVLGNAALALWLARLLFAPGMRQSLAACFGYSLLQATLGRGVLFFATLLLERRYHL